MIRRFTLALFLVACSGGPTSPLIPVGSDQGRLVASGYDGGDDAVLATGIRDIVLGVECSVERDEAGDWRCLPAQSGRVSYADEDCEQLVATVRPNSKTNELPPYIRFRVDFCSAEEHWRPYALLDESKEAGAYEIVEGRCVLRNKPSFGFTDERHFTAEPFDTEFLAKVDVTRVPFAEGIEARVATAIDGTNHQIGLHATTYDAPCVPVEIDGVRRCGPESNLVLSVASGQCGLSTPGSCAREPSPIAWMYTEASCGERRLVGLDLTSDTAPGGTACGAVVDGERKYHEFVFQDPTTLPEIPSAIRGEGRLEVRAREFFDRDLGTTCRPHELGGMLRCAPFAAGGFLETLYTDEGCTTEVKAIVLTAMVQASDYVVTRFDDDEVGITRIGEAFDIPLYMGQPEACFRANPVGQTCIQRYRVGERLDAETFAPMTFGTL